MLECVVNISEGRRKDVVERLAKVCDDALLDLHSDPHHNRSVFTLVGEEAPRALTRAAVALVDLRAHDGVHPRIGVVDVVPFVPLGDTTLDEAIRARDAFGAWAWSTLTVPSFRYGPERSLPDVRRHAFDVLAPDNGEPVPHPTAGAIAIGARPLLVAYNVWITGTDAVGARAIAAEVRGPGLRSLGLDVGGRFQISCNLTDPSVLGPAAAYDRIAAVAVRHRAMATGAELVGLVPHEVLAAVPEAEWPALDLSRERTIEARLDARRVG